MEQYYQMIQKTINFDNVIREETREHNLTWSHVPYHPYRILIIRVSGSQKINP